MPILRIKNSNGEWVEVPAIKGSDGKSAYEYAQQGGYVGTEDDFIEDLGKLSNNTGLNIAVDTELSTTSTNPVQNKAIANMFADMSQQDNLLRADINTANQNIETNKSNISTLQNLVNNTGLAVNQNTISINTINYVLEKTAKNDLSNVTYPANTPGTTTSGSGDRIVNTYISSDGKTWARIWASGWKECGINNFAPSSWTLTECVLPLNFTSTNTVNIQVSRLATSLTNSNVTVQSVGFTDLIVNSTKTSIKLYGDSGWKAFIYACGY